MAHIIIIKNNDSPRLPNDDNDDDDTYIVLHVSTEKGEISRSG